MSCEGTGHRVTIDETSESFMCAPTETVLVALASSGRRGIPVGCRGGGCGVCKVEVLQGSFRSRVMSRSHVTEQDACANRVLACCIYPESDLRVRVLGKMQQAIFRDEKVVGHTVRV